MLIVEVLKRMFTRQVSVRSLSGPIGIGQQIHEAVSMPGWMPVIGLMAYISLNLGIFNLLPIPILDGGMILFLLIESIIRRDVNQQIQRTRLSGRLRLPAGLRHLRHLQRHHEALHLQQAQTLEHSSCSCFWH